MREAEHLLIMADFILLAAQRLRAAAEPFRCDTFGCETVETDALDKACAEVDRVMDAGLLEAAKKSRESALAAAVQAEREACLAVVRDRANRHKAAAMAIPNISDPIRYNHECRQYELNALADALSLRPSPAPAVGEWRLERFGLWRFVVGERCLASVSTNINRWYTFSPEGGAGESGYVADLDSAKRAAVDALVRQGWYRETTPPGVDVMGVVREYLEARAQCNPCWSPAVKRYQVALDALRALVAPRTAEESLGVRPYSGVPVPGFIDGPCQACGKAGET